CCQQSRGYIYVGPVFAEEELDDSLCPWCIADGTAHQKFGAEFTDRSAIGDGGGSNHLAPQIVDEIATKTPGFSGWQQERWLTCCDDAAIFLGRYGRHDLVAAGSDAVKAIQDECGMTGSAWEQYLAVLDRDGSPSAYLFRCDSCGRFSGYSDCD
ncbi:MAG TPA: CbrC family protein, partial [Polyangiaceae bacterium]|nr:CbrC family protein [Polyangiaceae bacterium]